MKNLFELSEEEKNKIRGLHESHKDNYFTTLKHFDINDKLFFLRQENISL